MIAVTAGDVAEGLRDEGLADADGPEDDDVAMGLEEAKARQLGEHALVEAHLRRLVPRLEAHPRIEARLAGTQIGSDVVAPRDLVGEDEQQEIVKRHLLLVGEHESLGERVCDASELEALERADELRVEDGRRGRSHQSSSSLLRRGRAGPEVLLGSSEAREHELHDLAVRLRRRRRLRRLLERACDAHDVDDVERERALTDSLDAPVAVLLTEAQQRIRLTHARPRQRPAEQAFGVDA